MNSLNTLDGKLLVSGKGFFLAWRPADQLDMA